MRYVDRSTGSTFLYGEIGPEQIGHAVLSLVRSRPSRVEPQFRHT
jgi:hypothetical protein